MTIKVMLNVQRATRNGTYPLVIRLFGQQKKRLIYTNYYLKKEWFSDGKVLFYPSESGGIRKVKEINRYISKSVMKIKQLMVRYPGLSVEELTIRFKQEGDRQNVTIWFEYLIKNLEEAGAASTASNYRSTLHSVLSFSKKDALLLKEITGEWIRSYTAYLVGERKLRPNSVSFYLRVLRAVYNKAVSAGLISNKDNPFGKQPFGVQPTRKRAVRRESIQQLLDMCDHELTESQQQALDTLAFSFYARGMNFIDMARLRKEQLEEGYIVYRRSKTNKNLEVRITADLQKLIDRYDKSDSAYVLPFLHTGDKPDSYISYRNALARINRNLKSIGKMLGLSYPLTTYVARHSWASLAQESGVSVDIIRQSMGHSSIRTTEIYLSGFRKEMIDKANDDLLRWVFGKRDKKNDFLGKKEMNFSPLLMIP